MMKTVMVRGIVEAGLLLARSQDRDPLVATVAVIHLRTPDRILLVANSRPMVSFLFRASDLPVSLVNQFLYFLGEKSGNKSE